MKNIDHLSLRTTRRAIHASVMVRIVVAVSVIAGAMMSASPASADPYPPYWLGGSGPAIHFPVVQWPTDTAWTPYTMEGWTLNDPRTQDPSHGGARPQNYVNVSSGCPDQSLPSVYYAFDATSQVVYFRWRVEQIANTYATGPKAGAYSTSNPWKSALWTVLVDTNGDGYRDFAFHLNGSSGSPSEPIDRVVSIYSSLKNNSLNYKNNAAIKVITHTPAAFIDLSTNRILNFQNSLSPLPLWPNGSAETVWDYGTTRSVKLTTSSCTEFFIDYQLPIGMLDATSVGGPAATKNTPLSLAFATANSLQNPFQKDMVCNGPVIGDPNQVACFGDPMTFEDGIKQQPWILEVTATSCGPTTLLAKVLDSTTSDRKTTVNSVDFYYYYDANQNEIADDGYTWTFASSGTLVPNTTGYWTANWNSALLLEGKYLIGATATDTQGNKTWSYLTQTEVNNQFGATPPNYANPTPTPGIIYGEFINYCGTATPSIIKSVNPSNVLVGETVTFTLAVSNTTANILTINTVTDTLPPGFSYLTTLAGTLGTPSVNPTSNAIGTIAWQFSPAASVPAFNTRTLIFTAKAAMDQGTYVNIAAAKSGFGLLQSNPVSIGVGVPRLTLSKQANRLVANPGELVSYTLRYANDSPINTTNVIITDVLPLGMSFFSAAQGGIYISATRTISWVIGSIAPGDGPYDVTFVTKVDNPYPPDALLLSENTATITSNETFPQTATATVIINAPRPSLLIQKDSAVTQVPAGGAVPFTITYANAGNSAATNVVITDIAPAGFTILGASVGSVTTTTRVTWTLASVAAGASGAVTVTMRVSNPFTQTNPALNYAWISSTQTSPIFDDFWEGVTQFTQICSNYYFKDDKINVGVAGLQYPAVLTAPVPSDIGSVITVTTPVDLSYIEVTRFYQDPPVSIDVDFAGPITTSFWIDRANGPPITISSTMYAYNPEMGAMAFLGGNETSFNGNQKGMLNFVTNASGTLPAGSRLLLIVNVKQNTGGSNTIWFQFDGTAINVYSGGTTFAPSRLEYCVTAPPNLVLNKQVSSLIAIPGDSLTYTIKFANIGQTSATGSVITDVLPTGTSFITASLNGAPVTPYFVSGQTYAFNVNSPSQATGVITSAVTGTLSIAVKVSAPLTQSIDMLLNAVALGSTQTLPKYDTALTAVLRPDTSISKFSDKTLLNPGDVGTFSLVVQNSGVVTATNVTLSDTIPATPYFTYVLNSARHNGTVIAPDPVTGALLYYNAGALGPNAALTVTFQMSVSTTNAPNGLTYLSNMAAVTDTQTFGQRDSDPVIVTISTNPNLRVSKSVTPTGPLDGGALVTYTLTVTNIGGGDALDLFIRDAIPTYTNYVNGSLRLLGISQTDTIGDDNGEFDANVSEVVFRQSVLLRNSATYAQFTVRTDRPLPSGITPITNYVTAGASNAFPKSANVTVEASAMPILTISKSNKGLQDAVPYPATYLAAPASGAMVLQVVDSYYLSIGQYISINGQVRRITNLTDTLGLIEVNSSVTAAAGSLIAASYQYEVRFGNIGDAVAYTTVLTDYLPANTIFVTATQGGDHSGGIVTWSIDSLTSDADGLVEITVIPTTTGIYTNTVVIDSGQTSPLTATAQTPVGGLNVSKLTTTPMVVQTLNGTRATYVISVVNALPFAVSGVIITDALAAGYSYLQTLDVTGFSANSPVVTRTLGAEEPEWGVYTIPANGTLLITFTASISDTVGRGYYDNEVNVSAGNANVVQFDALRSSTDDVLVLLPEFNLVKRVLPAVVTSLGGPVTYTLVALNYTEGTATTTTITDTLPPGFYYLATDSITASSGVTRTAFVTPTQGDTMPNWGTWTVDAGHALTITFTSFANTMSGVYTNTALLVSDNATATVTNTTVLVAAPTVLTGIVRDDVTSQPIPGATVVVTDSLGRTYTTTTNASGAYTFTSTITNPMSSGLAAVAASAIGYVPAQYATTVVEGIVNIQDIDLYPNTLTGVVTDTATGFPIAGATVVFTVSTGSVFVTTTGVNGSYAFTSTVAQPIHTGTGSVTASAPGYIPAAGYTPGVTIVTGANVKNAPLTPLGGISGTVFNDQNGDSIYSTEPGIPGVVVTLTTATGLVYTAITDGNGGYNFSAIPGGTFTLTVGAVPAGFVATTAGQIVSVLTPGGSSTGNNFGFQLQADLGISKTDGQTTAAPGSTITYTIVVTNGGPAAVTNAPVNDILPAQITSASWTCVAGAGAGCAIPSGFGSIATTVNLNAGARVTFTVVAVVSGTAVGSIVNTAVVTVPFGVVDPIPGNNTATDTDTLSNTVLTGVIYDSITLLPIPSATVTVTDSAGHVYVIVTGPDGRYTVTNTVSTPLAPGGATVAASAPGYQPNSTPTTVIGGTVNVQDLPLLPLGDVSGYVYYDQNNNSSYNAEPGFNGVVVTLTTSTGDVRTTTTDGTGYYSFTGVPGGAFTVTVGTVPAGYNIRTEEPDGVITGKVLPAGGSSINNNFGYLLELDLGISKTDGVATTAPGSTITYTIVVTNGGVQAVTNAPVTDTLPAAIASATWTCVAGAGAGCATSSGFGSIATTVNLNAGARVTFTVVAVVSGTAVGSIVNTAVVTVPVGVVDPIPWNNTATDTDTLSNTVLTGVIYDSITLLPIPGATVTVTDSAGHVYVIVTGLDGRYTVTNTVSTPLAPGGATVAASAVGYQPASTPTTIIGGIVNVQDVPLTPITLTGVVTDTRTGFPIPGAVVVFTDSTGSVFTTTADINGRYWITTTVAKPIHTGPGNVASSHPGYETPVGYNPSVTIVPGANVKDAPLTPQIPILSATKLDALMIDADANSVPSPGDTVVYTIVVTNSGNGPATGVFLNDLPDANTTLEVGSVTTSQGTVITGNSAGNTSVAIDFGTLPARSQMTITFRVLINIPLPAGVTQVANQGIISSNELPAVVTDDPDTPQGSDPTVTPVVAAPVLGATKADALVVDSDGNGVASPGDTLVYTVTIVNTGNSAATGVVFYDTPGAYTTLVTGTVTTTQGNVTNGNGAVDSAVGVNVGTIPGNGGLVRITFRVKIMYPVPAGVTQVANQGTVSSSQLPVIPTDDPDTLPEGDPTVTPLTAAPIINSSKTVLLIVDADNNKIPSPGDTLLYQVQIQNSGNKAATGVVFTDTPGANTTLVTGSVQTTFGTVTSGNGAADSSVGVNIGTIQGGGSIVFISFRVKIANPLPAGVTQVANQGIVTNNEVVTPTLTDDPTTDPVGDPTITPVTAAPLLSAVKTVLPSGTALPGENLLYQITLVNNGNVAVSGVVFTDTPGANTTLVTGSVQTNAGVIVSGNANGQTIVGLNVGTIPGGGGTVQISFLVKIVDPLPAGVTQVANQGVVGTNELPPLLTDDPRTTPVGDPTVTPVSTFVQLALAKTVTPTVATPGGLLTYTISYGVTGNTVAVSVTVRDAVPANTTYESCSGAPCSQSGGVVVWTLGNKAPPNSGNVTLVVRAVSPLPNGTLITNTATITEASGQSAQAQVVVPVASSHQLAVSKSAVPSPVSAGGLLTYTIAYTVAGNEVATGVVLNDVVPANTTYQSCTGGVTCGINGSTVRWSLGNLSPSANGAVTLVVRVNTPLISGTQVVNNVTITDTNNGGTAQAQVTVPVVSSHVLEVSKRATPSPVSPNGLLTYTIAYTVTGNEPAPGVTLRDVLPVNTSFVACVDVPCSQSGGIVTWILGTLNPPANGFVTFVVRVTNLLANGTLITNTVSMTDTSGLTTTGQVVVPVVSSHQLAVSKNAMPSPVAAGGLLTYTITYTVTGNEPAVGVTLNDTLPANTSYESCSGAPCSQINGNVIWNLGNLNPVVSGAVTLVVRVSAPLISGTQIVNNVTLTDTNGGGTAQAQAITPVVSSHQIAVSKSATPLPVAPGGLLTYTIAYTVTGNEPAQGVTLRDTIPANTTYVDCLSACTLTGGVASWNLGTLNPPTNGTVTLVVRLNTPLPNGTLITNTVSMTDTSGVTSTGQVVVPVVSSHLLQVSKSAASPTVIPGGLIVYTIIYTVTGNEMANGVTLTDALPANTSFDSCPTSLCNVNNGVVTWNLGNITPPVDGVVTLIVKAADVLPNNLPITNTVTLFDTSGQTVNAQAIVNVVSSYVLTVNKTASTAPVNAGDLLTYTINYTVTGNAPATGVSVKDTLPTNTAFVSCNGSPCSQVNGAVVWNIGNVNPPANGVLTLVVRVAGVLPNGTLIINTVLVSDTTGITNTNTNTVTTPVASSHELAVLKTATPSPVEAGGLLTYTIVYSVTGNEPANGVVLTDALPANTTFQSCAGAVCGFNNGAVTWSLGNLTPPTFGTVQLVVRVTSPLPSGTLITNSVTIGDASGQTAQSQVVVPVASSHQIAVTKSASPSTAVPGSLLIYTIQYTVTGNEVASGVTLVDNLPAHTSFVNCAGAPCAQNNGKVTWSLGNLTPPTFGAVTLIVQVADVLTDGLQIANSVFVSDTTGITNTSTVTVPVVSSHALTVTKTADAQTAIPGSLLTYTIAYTVTGNAPAAGLTVIDTLPANTTYVSCGGAPCSQTNGSVVWTLGTINPPADGLLTLVVRIADVLPNGTPIANTVLVSDTTGITNTDTVTTPVVSSHQLTVLKQASASVVEPGDQLTYTMQYTVTGNEPAPNVIITDVLPANVIPVSCNPVNCQAFLGTVSWNLGTIIPPASGTVMVVVQVSSDVISGTQLVNSVVIVDGTGVTNTNTITTPVLNLFAALNVHKTAIPLPGSTVKAGDLITYTITVTNYGNIPATNVVITDAIPAETEYVAGSATPEPFSGPDPLVWTVPSLPPYQPYAVSFTVRVLTLTNAIVNVGTVSGDGLPPVPTPIVVNPPVPSAVTLSNFNAQVALEGTVTLSWMTTLEIDTAGFNILRSTDGSRENAVVINVGLVPTQPGSGLKEYAFADADIQPNVTYSYWLQEVETGGGVNEYGPVSATRQTMKRIYMPFVLR